LAYVSPIFPPPQSPSPACGGGLGWGLKCAINPMKIKFGVNHVSEIPYGRFTREIY
jgi:hypothetical protein